MEPAEMKLAWQTLRPQFERQHALNLHHSRDRRLDRLRSGLRPLVWGQAIQMAVGVLGLLALAPIWVTHMGNPAVLVSGLVVHAYCVGLIVVGAMMQSRIARIEYGAPVLAIQRRLLQLRHTYSVVGTIVCGLPWWFLTAPLLVVLSRGGIMRSAPWAIWAQLAIGAAGRRATGGFYRWAHCPQRAEFGRRLDDSNAGGSLRRAQAALDDLARFEQE